MDHDENRINIEERPKWLVASQLARNRLLKGIENNEFDSTHGPLPERLSGLRAWCDPELFNELHWTRTKFDTIDEGTLHKEIRSRANPHESLVRNNHCVVSRFAHALGSLDRVYDFILTGEKEETLLIKRPMNFLEPGQNIDRNADMFYFAESQVLPCAFCSQYIQLRKGFYNSKCFVPKIDTSFTYSPFFTLGMVDWVKNCVKEYGKAFDAYALPCRSKFADLIMRGTDGKGVHLYFGSPITSREYGQDSGAKNELFFRSSYVGQLLYACSIVREGGNAVIHVLDTFSTLSVSVIYLAHIAFDRISIYKPNTSRPANSEKFLVCHGRRVRESEMIKKYLEKALNDESNDNALLALIPEDFLRHDKDFRGYVTAVNEDLALRQIRFLSKYERMMNNCDLVDTHQEECLNICVPFYKIPLVSFSDFKQLLVDENKRNPNMVFSKFFQELENIDEILSRPPTKFDPTLLEERNREILVTPCGDSEHRLIVSTTYAVGYRDTSLGEWSELDNAHTIPPDSILLADITNIDNATKPSLLVRILDAAVLFGDDISNLPFSDRLKAAEKFAHACSKIGLQNKTIYRVAKYKNIAKGWKSESIPDAIRAGPYHFQKKYLRFVQDTRLSFIEMLGNKGISRLQ